MRENKYRVWCLDRKEWEKEETYLTPDGRLFRKYVLDGKWRDDTKLHIVEFYTGLKDKNGVEIYDGDNVKHDKYGLLAVYYLFGSFWIGDGDDNGSTFDLPLSDYMNDNLIDIEVIGNIHEEVK